MKRQFLKGSSLGTLTVTHKFGWTHTHASINNSTLLILDEYKTHTQNTFIIDKARQNGVTILYLPPHFSHRIKPLDVSFMAPLRTRDFGLETTPTNMLLKVKLPHYLARRA